MSISFPEPPPAISATTLEALDTIVHRLASTKNAYAALSIDARLELLDSLQHQLVLVADEWARLDALGKGLWPDSNEAGETFLAGPLLMMRNIRLLRQSLAEIRDAGVPHIAPQAMHERPDGRLVVKVFPHGIWDHALYLGYSGEVWMEPGVTRQNLAQHQAAAYRQNPPGKLALILGAGNQSAIPPMDALYKLFVEKQVVLLKMNPVNEYLGPVFRQLFQPLVDAGWFEVVYGGGKEGEFLCHHSEIDTIHITGSDRTHDAIVWGPPEGREQRKQQGEKLLRKEITSELGNVTPVIVVPGEWTEKQLSFQAKNVVAMVTNNASFNCIAGKVLVLSKEWLQKQAFLDAIRRELAAAPPRKAYYPGAQERWKNFIDTYPQSEVLGTTGDEVVPWTFILHPHLAAESRMALRVEPFCGILHEVELSARNAADFIEQATSFSNDQVWGTLGIAVLISPASRKDPTIEHAFQQALDELRYGSICVNHWPGLAYGAVTTSWGAYPGHTLEDIQSGRGIVHNTFLFDKPQKSVIYGPFMPLLRPPWFHDHGGLGKLGKKLLNFEAAPSLSRLLPVIPHALK